MVPSPHPTLPPSTPLILSDKHLSAPECSVCEHNRYRGERIYLICPTSPSRRPMQTITDTSLHTHTRTHLSAEIMAIRYECMCVLIMHSRYLRFFVLCVCVLTKTLMRSHISTNKARARRFLYPYGIDDKRNRTQNA